MTTTVVIISSDVDQLVIFLGEAHFLKRLNFGCRGIYSSDLVHHCATLVELPGGVEELGRLWDEEKCYGRHQQAQRDRAIVNHDGILRHELEQESAKSQTESHA